MTIFDFQDDELLRLSEGELEELVGRLAEAEAASAGESPSCVFWSRGTKTPDGGVDVQVDVPAPNFSTGFLKRPNTIFQAKKDSTSKGKIDKEMRKGGKLIPAIVQQAKEGGSYIIVCLEDDCTKPMRAARLGAMRNAVAGVQNTGSLHLDFYDRSKLHQWLRQHPSVIIWVRGILGQSLSGWRPYGSWSNPPKGADDTLIQAPGISVVIPGDPKKLSIENAIEPVRNLIRSTKKAIRIVGLSGVGKTRFVQALFDKGIGKNPLDRTIAVYADVGAGPVPPANTMLDRLIEEERKAILILDNCPPDLHSNLVARATYAGTDVQLITVEYDIRDDKPQTTEVIQITSHGPEIAEQLILRRFPNVDVFDARKIANFADGNCRISLALAERTEGGKSLAKLRDDELFNRLFFQGRKHDDQLRADAEVLSLVYSFSVAKKEKGIDELSVLGSLYETFRTQLFRSAQELLERNVVQYRSQWRAVLPQAIANRLARSALYRVPVETLRNTFEQSTHERLLMSFAHRLGFMHDHPIAQEIVGAWLHEGSLLYPILELNEERAKILGYVGPTAPDLILGRIEDEINSSEFTGLPQSLSLGRVVILNLLVSLAYEPEKFDRCIALLFRVADFEEASNNHDPVRDKIIQFFQPYLSGSHASIEQRAEALRNALWSADTGRQLLGIRMLSTALSGPPWRYMGTNDFGARPRDFGFKPNKQKLAEWHNCFIDIAVEAGLDDEEELAVEARSILANNFRYLWSKSAIRNRLFNAAKKLNAKQPWIEGWQAIRLIIHLDYRKSKPNHKIRPLPKELADLEAELAPSDMISEIKTFIVSNRHNLWSLDDEFNFDDEKKYKKSQERLDKKAQELGERFARFGKEVTVLGAELFSIGDMPHRESFGRGMALGARNRQSFWNELVAAFCTLREKSFNCSVLCGFIAQVDQEDHELAQRLLDQSLEDPVLRLILPSLHPNSSFDEGDLDRCIQALEYPEVILGSYWELLWQPHYKNLPLSKLLRLAELMLKKPNGDSDILRALNMKLHNTDPQIDVLGKEFRQIGLIAARTRILREENDFGGDTDHNMKHVVEAALRFNGNEEEKIAWIDAIFEFVEQHSGYMHDFYSAVQISAALMPEKFMDGVFSGDKEKRIHFIKRECMDRLPLDRVNVGALIAWCQKQSDPKVWETVATGMSLWVSNGDDKPMSFNDNAIRFLEVAPDPETILEVYANRARPQSWSGKRSDIIERRAFAFRELLEHPNVKISTSAKRIPERLTKWIEQEREQERSYDKEEEQRFE